MLRSMYDINMFGAIAQVTDATGMATSGSAAATRITLDTTAKGRQGGNTIKFVNDGDGSMDTFVLVIPLKTGLVSEVYMGMRMLLSPWAPNLTRAPFDFYDGALNTVQVSFQIAQDGTLTAWRGSRTTLLGTASAQVPIGSLFHIGFAIKFDNTSGYINIELNGVNILSVTGINTTSSANNYATSFRVRNMGNPTNTTGLTTAYIGEVFTGDTVAPGMVALPGDVGISHLRPTADGTYTAWTPSTGSAWGCVDETVLDAADYISTTGAANKASFQVSDLTAAMGGVKALAPFAIAAKPEAGDTNVACGVITNSTEVQGTAHAPGATSTLVQTIYEKNPVTSNDWTSGEVNALQVLYTSV